MRYLHLGRVVRVVSDEVAASWGDVANQAEQETTEHGGHAVVYIRTDAGAFGSIPVTPNAPITFTDQGPATTPDLGIIVAVSAELEEITSAIEAERGPEPERTDAELAELAERMKKDRPHLDWDNLLTGKLAGPATPGRPDVPVWDYITFVDNHPEVRLSDLTAVRFPVQYFKGSSSVTSVDEELRPFPSSLRGSPPQPRFPRTPHSVIDRYRALHDAEVITWDPDQRGVIYVKPTGSYRAVLYAWANSLDSSRSAAPPCTAGSRKPAPETCTR
jgi:hypothetical protein